MSVQRRQQWRRNAARTDFMNVVGSHMCLHLIGGCGSRVGVGKSRPRQASEVRPVRKSLAILRLIIVHETYQMLEVTGRASGQIRPSSRSKARTRWRRSFDNARRRRQLPTRDRSSNCPKMKALLPKWVLYMDATSSVSCSSASR